MDRFKRCNYDSKELARNLFVEKITKNSGIICGKPYTMDPLRLCPSFGKNNQIVGYIKTKLVVPTVVKPIG